MARQKPTLVDEKGRTFDKGEISKTIVDVRRNYRICLPEFFNNYFRITSAPYRITKEEFDAWLKEIPNQKKSVTRLKSFMNAGRIDGCLEKLDCNNLDSNTKNLPKEILDPLVIVLFNFADNLSFEQFQKLNTWGPNFPLTMIVINVVRRLESEEDRFQLLLKSIRASNTPFVVTWMMESLSEFCTEPHVLCLRKILYKIKR